MKKLADLSPIEKSQISAFLKSFDADESISVYPMSTWNILVDCGLTQIIFRKCLNKLAEFELGKFESGVGSITFSLTSKGKKWLSKKRP